MDTLIIIGILLAIAATIVLYIKVMPKKYDGKLENKFLQFLHDFFHFKTFYIEALTKFVFVLLTCACIFVGSLLLFARSNTTATSAQRLNRAPSCTGSAL